MSTVRAWPRALYDTLRRADVTLFSFVPDGGHRELMALAESDPDVRAVTLTSEQEGVALAAGAHLGHARAVLLIQSSGVGNIVNMLSLIAAGRFPCLIIVTMRGEFGEGNPWQRPMGEATPAVLAAMGVSCLRVEREEEVVPTAEAALTMAYKAGAAVAILLSQRFLGAKPF
jgi:sulfopyruvate decarboxylase alpha subunit